MDANAAKVAEYMTIKRGHMSNVQGEYNKRMVAMQNMQAAQSKWALLLLT